MYKSNEILELEMSLKILLSESSDIFEKNTYYLNEEKEIINLNLSGNNIADISFLESYTSLNILNLSNNIISDISILEDLTELTYLDVSNNIISDISSIAYLVNLRTLNLGFNQVFDIYILENLIDLTYLNLSYNNIEDISSIKYLLDLVKLNLSFNNISDISYLKNLLNINDLNLSNNKIDNISSLENLKTLLNLNLNKNLISDILVLENFDLIKDLILSNNKISNLSCLKNLTNLKSLNLSNNIIFDISSLENLVEIITLNLDINQISDMSTITNLKNLVILNLGNNKISNPPILNKFVNISELNLSNNKISDLSFLENLNTLTKLDLSYNEIKNPIILKSLKNLTNLYLNNIGINDFSFINHLESIYSLFLGSNDISNISFLRNMKKLKFLYLSYNNISDISVLKELINLTSLYLNKNKIYDITILQNLTLIKDLDLRDNEIVNIEQFEYIVETSNINIRAINNPCFNNYSLEKDKNNYDTIVNILKKIIETKQEYVLPAKVLLLGNSGSGKSTLLDYLLQETETRIIEEKIISTHVVQIQTLPKRIRKNEIPKAVFYDFGGQDYYHGLYKAFLSSNSLNVLLWNNDYDRNQIRIDRNGLLTRDYNRDYWLHQLKFQYANNDVNNNLNTVNETILLVQTGADFDTHYRDSYKGNSEDFNIKNEFFLSLNPKAILNSKTLNISLHYFEETLKEQIKLKQIVKNEPIWYKEFLNYILRTNKNTFTSLSDLEKEYKRDTDPQNLLLPEVLREIAQTGLILYYKDDEDLKDIVWLDPSKAIQNIHKSILSRKNIIEKKGVINQDDFDKLVDQRLTKLLLNQKVIFFDLFDNKYIIPGYLNLTEEDDKIYELLTFDFIEPNFILKFKYFIPLGLINQLICYYGKNKNKKYYWRDQLLFTEQNSKVLIKLDFTNLEISVSIKSNEDHKKTDRLEQKIFKNILDLYWDINEEEEDIEIKKGNISIENIIDGKLKYNNSHHIYQNSYMSPEDLFISIDNKYFVHHKTLENKDVTINKITSFGLDYRLEIQNGREIKIRTIDMSKSTELASGIYKNFTNNDNAKKMKKIFISYAKENKKEVNEFQKQISPFKLTREVETWHCSELELGEDWDSKIKNKFYDADIILYFISTDFFSTPYILDEEVKRGIERDKDPSDDVVLIPIILEKIHWEDLLGKYSSNFKGIPISLYEKTNNAWYEVVDDLKKQHFRKPDADSTAGILGQSKDKMNAQENVIARKL